MAWYRHQVVALLEQAQREAIAVVGQRTNSTLVAQSLGAFTAAVVCERVSVGKLVFVNAMLPVPGETAGDWWENTCAIRARIAAAESAGYRTEFDLQTYLLHDLPEGSYGQDRRTCATKRKSFSDSPATFAAGRRYQCVSLVRPTIGFFRWNFKGTCLCTPQDRCARSSGRSFSCSLESREARRAISWVRARMCLKTRAFTRDEARRIADNVGKLPALARRVSRWPEAGRHLSIRD